MRLNYRSKSFYLFTNHEGKNYDVFGFWYAQPADLSILEEDMFLVNYYIVDRDVSLPKIGPFNQLPERRQVGFVYRVDEWITGRVRDNGFFLPTKTRFLTELRDLVLKEYETPAPEPDPTDGWV